MAGEAGGARFIKDESKIVVTKKLKENEISMLFILAIVAVAALGTYFVLYPMFTNMRTLTDEIDTLKNQESEYRNQIALTEIYKSQYEEAQNEFNQFFSYFHSPMDPEIIDERVTSMLIAHQMTPASLSMTTLEVESIPPYRAEELRANPVPESTEPPEDEGAGEVIVPPADGTDEDSDLGEYIYDYIDDAALAAEEIAYAFVYTVDVSAYGDRANLYTFLAQVAPMTAMHVISFDFTDPSSERDLEGVTTTTPGQINMQIKMYVLIEGVPARDFGAGGQ